MFELEKMTAKRATKFYPIIDRKLKVENITKGDHALARKVLSKCVLGGVLVRAYVFRNQ